MAENKQVLQDVHVQCATHGPMKYRLSTYLWECLGFDGEGCCTVSDEEVYVILADRDGGSTQSILVGGSNETLTSVTVEISPKRGK